MKIYTAGIMTKWKKYVIVKCRKKDNKSRKEGTRMTMLCLYYLDSKNFEEPLSNRGQGLFVLCSYKGKRRTDSCMGSYQNRKTN